MAFVILALFSIGLVVLYAGLTGQSIREVVLQWTRIGR